MTIARTLKTSITENELNNSVVLFPNPTKGTVTLDLQNFKGSINQINILNLQGQVITALSDIQQEERIQFSVSDFASGVYFIQIQTANGVLSKKLILEK